MRTWLREHGAVVIFWGTIGLAFGGYYAWSWLNATPVEPPVASMTFDNVEAVVKLGPESTINDAMNMGVFLGVTPHDLPNKFGEASVRDADSSPGAFCREHWSNNSRFVFRGRVEELSVFPPNLHFEKLFCEQIAKHLRGKSLTRVRIRVGEGEDTTRVAVTLDGVRVNEIIWYP